MYLKMIRGPFPHMVFVSRGWGYQLGYFWATMHHFQDLSKIYNSTQLPYFWR